MSRASSPPGGRWLAGSHGQAPSSTAAVVAGLLPGAPAYRTDALYLTWTGPAPGRAGTMRCLLDGRVHDLGVLARELALPPDLGAEDTLAAAYARLGPGLWPRLHGEWVAVVWDTAGTHAVIARDPLGARPVFLRRQGAGVVFASEVRLLLDALPSRPGPDRAAVASWLAGTLERTPRTMYEGIERLEPGCLLTLGDGPPRPARHWSPLYGAPVARTRAEAAEVVREELRGAVARSLEGHAHAAILLSGGLDSSSLAATAAALAGDRGTRLTAASAVFPDHPELDEAPLIDGHAARLGLPVLRRVVRDGSPFTAALEFVDDWQLPLGPPGHFVWRPLLRDASQMGATIALDGEGGDELFGAPSSLLADRLRAGQPLAALALARAYPGAGRAPGRRLLLELLLDFGVRPLLPGRLRDASGAVDRAGWLRPEAARLLAGPRRDPDRHPEAPLWWSEMAHALTTVPEAVGLYDYYRRRGVDAGLLARHPMLDLRLIQTVLALPPELSFDPLLTRPVLREAMRGTLPDELRLRRGKSYFDRLLGDGLREDLPHMRELLDDPRAEIAAYVDRDAISKLLRPPAADGRASLVSWTRRLWRLATAEAWLRSQSEPDLPQRVLERRTAASGGLAFFPTPKLPGARKIGPANRLMEEA